MTGSRRTIAWFLAPLTTAGAIVAVWSLVDLAPPPTPPAAGPPAPEEAARRALVAALVDQIAADSRTGDRAPTPIPASGAASSRDADPGARLQPQVAAQAVVNAVIGMADPSGEPAEYPPDGLDWLGSPGSLATLSSAAESAGRDWTFGWLRLRGGARLDAAEPALSALGAVVEGAAGPLVRVRLPADSDRLRAITALPGIDGLGAAPVSAKLPSGFAEEARRKPTGEIVPVFVTLAAADDADGQWRMGLERLGAVVGTYDADTRAYAANVAYGLLETVAAADFVAFVEPVGIVRTMNDTAVPAMGADAYRDYTAVGAFRGVAGAGAAVGVMDTGLNINHVDIASGRESVCGANFFPGEDADLWIDDNGHGTHVTATIAGNGAGEARYAGMAPLAAHLRFAKVLSRQGSGWASSIIAGMDFLRTATACGRFRVSDAGIRAPIVNMSLAATSRDFRGRGVAARKLDAVVWDARQLYVVANSNSGNRGFSNYGAAKNSLAVGAALDSGELAGFSSHGPTADGRLAPLVVGAGVDVFSANGEGRRGGYVALSGTSMSSPAVAGVAALLMDERAAFSSRPSLARAHLMASAVKPDAWLDDSDGFPPHNTAGPGAIQARYGLGKVSASAAVRDRARPDGWQTGNSGEVELGQGQYASLGIHVPEGTSRLDVVLTWDEPPADVLANPVLNDLDLWLDAGADCTAARCGEHSSRSRRDNVEWMIVRDPAPGTWRAKAVAETVYGDKPRAALAYALIRGPSTPALTLDADRRVWSPGRKLTLKVSADGYVAAGVRLGMECRDAEGAPCMATARYEILGESIRSGEIGVGDFLAVGEIRAGKPASIRLAVLLIEGDASEASIHFTATSWNATADTKMVLTDGDMPVPSVQRPANDAFGAAAVLSDAAAGDLLLATTEPGEAVFENNAARPAASVWYRWTASNAGPAHFSVSPEAAFDDIARSEYSWQNPDLDMRVDVYDGGSIAGLTTVASAPWGTSFTAERGGEYVVRVSSRTRMAPFTLTVARGDAPANDAFDAAADLEGSEGTYAGTNAGATLESGELFGPLAATAWHRWTAPEDGWWTFRSSVHHLNVLAFSGDALGGLRLVSGYPDRETAFPAESGETYRIAVAADDAEAAGSEFELSWAPVEEPDPGNDMMEGASEFPDAQSGNGWHRVEASSTVEPGEPAESGQRTVWRSWTAPATGEYTWRLRDARHVRLSAFEGEAPADLGSVAATEQGVREFTFGADEGQAYHFALATRGEAVFTERTPGSNVAWGPTPANDARSGAATLTGAGGSVGGSSRYATTERGERTFDTGHSSLWWTFEAPGPGWYRFRIEQDWLPFVLSAYRADAGDAPGEMEMVASSLREFEDGVAILLHAPRRGTEFTIRLGIRGDADGGDFTLRWEEAETPVWLRYADRLAVPWRGLDVYELGAVAMHDSGEALYALTHDDRDSSRATRLAVLARDAETGRLTPEATLTTDYAKWLFWDSHRDRLLGFDECSVRAWTPAEGDVLDLGDAADMPVEGDCPPADVKAAFVDPDGEYLYVQPDRGSLRVFKFDEDAVRHVQTSAYWTRAAAMSHGGGKVYTVDYGTLRVLDRDAETGELALAGSTSLGVTDNAGLAVSGNGDLVFAVGRGATVVDVSDPDDPRVLGRLAEFPRERSWRWPQCGFATVRDGRAAADAFCDNGSAYAVEWRAADGELVLTDHVADWRVNRYNDLVPAFRDAVSFAASPDGRHGYVGTAEHGVLVFERGPLVTEDDHGDTAGTATVLASLPWSGRAMLESEGDRDWFRLEIASTGTLVVETTGDVDTFGTLRNADGEALAEDDDSGTGNNFSIRYDAAEGAHFVEVRAFDEAQTGAYGLSVECTPDDRVPAPPTDLAASPGEGEARLSWSASGDDGGSPVIRHEYRQRDEDAAYGVWRAIPDSAPGEANATAFTVTELENGVRVFFGVRAVNAVGASGPSNEAGVTPGTDAGAAFSAARVIGEHGASSTQATDLDGDGDPDVVTGHERSVVWHENQGEGTLFAQDDDHGDTVATATALSLGATLEGTIDDPDDVDWFSVAIEESGVVTTETSGDTDTVGRLLDADGAELARNDDGGEGFNFRIQRELAPGTYIVEVAGFGGETGTYEVSARGAATGGVSIPDEELRGAIARELGKEAGAAITEEDLATLTSLSACCRVRDLTGLEYAVNLESLRLNSNRLSDLGPLRGLSKLTSLDLRNNEIRDLGPLAGLAALEALDLANNDISELAPLTGLTALTRLVLEGNAVSALGSLGGLSRLTSLRLANNSVADLSPLGALRAMRYLYVDGNDVTDLAPLANMGELETIDADWNRITDIYPLAGLGEIRSLSLIGNNVTDLTPLDGKSSLRRLHLQRNGLTDISPLARSTSLDTLGLADNGIADVSPLATLGDLRELELGGNAISDVHGLADLRLLRTLELDRNRITDVAPLGGLTGLWSLDLADNLIADTRGLQTLGELRTLSLARNRITYLAGVGALEELRSLDLSNNEIVDVAALAELGALAVLDIGGNRIADLAPLAGLTSLRELDVDANRVAGVDAVADSEALRRLYFGGNAVGGVGSLLHHAPNLDEASIWRNPLGSADRTALEDRDVRVVGAGHLLPLLAHGRSRQGFVRLVNLAYEEADAWAYAAGDRDARPIGIVVGGSAVVHFNADDALKGNRTKGVFGQLPIGTDDALEVYASTPFRAYGYMRTSDGFLTSMHDIAPTTADGEHRVVVFNPGSNTRQVSLLRVVNLADAAASVSVRGTDDAGVAAGPVRFVLAARQSSTLSAATLESGAGSGLEGRLGDGTGKWRLDVASDEDIVVMSLLESPTGHLTNLSTAPPGNVVPLFPSASDPVRQGFVRVVNHGEVAAEVRVRGVDDAGTRRGPLEVQIPAGRTIHFNSGDWENGNADKGLWGNGVGPGTGDWRLRVDGRDVEALGYVRTRDGFLTSMHDRVESDCAGRDLSIGFGPLFCLLALLGGAEFYPVPVFNPASNDRQVSSLRLINDEARDVSVSITGVDDRGLRAGRVQLTVPAGTVRTLTARELERGRVGMGGSLGDGTGKWELLVTATEGRLTVMNLLTSPSGHMTNLSTAPTVQVPSP